MSAAIEVRNVFNVKGRGAVAIGYPGAGPHRVLTVAAVEAMHPPDGGAGVLGLVFREKPSLEELRSALTPAPCQADTVSYRAESRVASANGRSA